MAAKYQQALGYIKKNKEFFIDPFIRRLRFHAWADQKSAFMAPIHNALTSSLKTNKLLTEYKNALVGKGNTDRLESLWRGAENRISDLLKSSPELVSAILVIKENHDKTVQFYISHEATPNESGKLNDLTINRKDSLDLSQKMVINKSILTLRIKGEKLKDRGHHDEYKTAINLADFLQQKVDFLFSMPQEERQQHIEQFKHECNTEINKAMSILKHHRGWKQILGNLLLAIAGLGVGYIVAGIINKGRTGNFLFFNSTDSSEKLEATNNTIRLRTP